MATKKQVSAGGVVFRRTTGGRVEVALISVGERGRWQLPKGLVGAGESAERAALRETREETGLAAEMVAPVDTVEYWYVAAERGRRVRFHKFVHFYLLRYAGGEVTGHDHEVNEARWFAVDEAHAALAFDNEKRIVERAREMIRAVAD